MNFFTNLDRREWKKDLNLHTDSMVKIAFWKSKVEPYFLRFVPNIFIILYWFSIIFIVFVST